MTLSRVWLTKAAVGLFLAVLSLLVFTVVVALGKPMVVKDINPGDGASSQSNFTDVNGALYFIADDGFTGSELSVALVNADLAAAKSSPPMVYVSGQPMTYKVTVTNNGPSTSTNVVLTDTLPSQVTFVSSIPSAPRAPSRPE